MVKYKDVGVAYLLLALSFLGFCGINRFYLGKVGTGILFFFTGGLFGIGLIYDLITTPKQVKEINGESFQLVRSKEYSITNLK